ncbi:hypothetical protein FNV43_RR09928 [Rhamnella rubrinervis]|uniref:Uncharacterized protein n=1 Tax=Rhamnella rubrinervis TaxID=2594499 RepID=A0A8K0HBD0_9ROSA|nr:hypothetical protein FNV43_RR09928 [Rhamnella rubrinervis]
MEKHQYGLLLILSVVASLGLISCVSCIAAELKKSKAKDVKLDGRLCYLPGSDAFGFGIAALVCLSIAHIIGNLINCIYFCSKERSDNCKFKKPTLSTPLLLISWISFGIAVTLLGTATSMSVRQAYGKGWLNGECYLVKDGVFIGSALLVLVTVGSALGSALAGMRKTKVDQRSQIHQPLESKILG